MSGNAVSTIANTDNKEDQKVTINTIDRTAFVERLPDPRYKRSSFNAFAPNKVRSMIQRSSTATSCVDTLSEFLSGQGFGDDVNNIVINDDKQILWDILRHASNEKSSFKGLALHVNYNLLGEIVEINEISFDNLRYLRDLQKIIYQDDWRRYNKNKAIEYDLFDPENAVNEMNEVGIDEYNGQVLYWIPRKHDIYTTCRCDHGLDDIQFEAESAIYKLSNVQNEYSANVLFKYPLNLKSDKENEAIINTINIIVI